MKNICFAPNIAINLIASEVLCRENQTTPQKMQQIYENYTERMREFIGFYHLNHVQFIFNVDNYRGASIERNADLRLFWEDFPQGFVTIRLGNHDDNEIDPRDDSHHRLCHELVHVLIFAFLTSFLNFPTEWKPSNSLFNLMGHFLPQHCNIPKIYIELLCDTIGLMAFRSQTEHYLQKWAIEWDPKYFALYGGYYYSKDHRFAIDFIRHHINILADRIPLPNTDWKAILEYFFITDEAKRWMNNVASTLG